MYSLSKNGMVTLENAAGERIERWPVDARELIQGEWRMVGEGEVLSPALMLIADTVDKPAKVNGPTVDVVADAPAPAASNKKK